MDRLAAVEAIAAAFFLGVDRDVRELVERGEARVVGQRRLHGGAAQPGCGRSRLGSSDGRSRLTGSAQRQAAEALGVRGLGRAAYAGIASRVADLAEAVPLSSVAHGGADLCERDAGAVDRVEVHRDLELVRCDALELDASDSLDSLDRPHDVLLDQVVVFGQIGAAGDAHLHDRLVVAAVAADLDVLDELGQLAAHSIHAVAQLELARVGIAAGLELEVHAHAPGARADLDALEPAQARDRFLERTDELALEHFGARARDLDLHVHAGRVLARQERQRHLRQPDDAEQEHRDERHADRHGPGEREVGEAPASHRRGGRQDSALVGARRGPGRRASRR